MLALAAAVIIVALVVVPGDDDDGERAASTTTEQAPVAEAPGTGSDAEEPAPTPKPKPPLLRAGNGRQLTFTMGETIRFRVRHGEDEEVHVHGYDESKAIKAGETTTMSFPATIEGIFEIELERSATPIGSLKVEPK